MKYLLTLITLLLPVLIFATTEYEAESGVPELITTRDDLIQSLLGTCTATTNDCSEDSDCCSECCFGNSVCLDKKTCDDICLVTSRLSYCKENSNCCS